MARYFGPQCDGCSGEDCVCCEVYIESRAESYEYDPSEEWDRDHRAEYDEWMEGEESPEEEEEIYDDEY